MQGYNFTNKKHSNRKVKKLDVSASTYIFLYFKIGLLPQVIEPRTCRDDSIISGLE